MEIHFGHGPQPIQVAVAESSGEPTRTVLKALFAERKGNLNTLIVVVVHGDQASLFGPDADTEVMRQKASTTEAILNSILDQPSEVLAYQRATSIWRSKQTTDLVGFTNNGLFASHYIRSSVNHHPKWKATQEASQKIQNLRDLELITALGFEITSRPSNTFVLSAKGQDHRAVAILLDHSESFESKSTRLQASPVEWSLAIAAEQSAPWVIAIKDSQLRLYPAKDGVGVGQKSQAETYFEIDLLTIDGDKTGLLNLIFSAEALAEGGTADELLANSRKFASELGVRLRERVYESVVPLLATEVANQLRSKGHQLDSKGLQMSYELTLRILFRLLFQAYAEDRGLLPAGRNENFDKNSMKHWAQYLRDRDVDAPYGDASTIWFDLIQVWDAIDQGNPDMQIPAYNGGLFGSSPELHPEGALIRNLSIPDRVLAPALRALVIDDNTEDGVAGAVDFRSLSVREFGTIYEGLLESSLSVADQDLTVDSKGAWVPAKPGDEVLAATNEVYFHSASGERKATGSYYTPSFIVDHLVDRSVEPALIDHLARVKELIDAGDQSAAYKAFFDFRVADLAMGSAHFLVAAIDKIETVMRSFLLKPGNEIDGVSAELLRLDDAAKVALGKDEAAYAEIERASLLRRQIARRCIYGLDINPMAVELSRLAIWIHTFVPGLPMSSLDHNLVCANSLTGIATQEEGLNALLPERARQGTSFVDPIVEQALNEARVLLEEVAFADEASKAQAKRAAEVAKQARELAHKSKIVFDLGVANRAGVITSNAAMTMEGLTELTQTEGFSELIEELRPAHMPYLFPEVFLRDHPGFDVLLGNPPWEELVIDKTRFWASKVPGLLSLPVQQRDLKISELEKTKPQLFEEYQRRNESLGKIRAILQSRFPMGVGDADLYKAFGWVALELLSKRGGRLGFVLPKTAFSAAGMQDWRRALQARGSMLDLTYLVNTGRWVFNIEPRYSIALLVYQAGSESDLSLAGPIHSRLDFERLPRLEKVKLGKNLLLKFTESASIPGVADQKTADVLSLMRLSPSLSDFGGGRFRAVREFDATIDRKFFDHATQSRGLPVLSGRSFNHWRPETGEIFAVADPEIALPELNRKLLSQLRLKSSAFHGLSFDAELGGKHPIHRPRIAFRGVTRSNDSRTFICALVPPMVVLTNIAPYFLSTVGSEKKEALLLGVTSSLIFDWYARKFIETAVNFHLLNAFPIPRFENLKTESKIIEIAGRMAAVDARYSDWAKAVGVEVDSVTDDAQKGDLVAQLDGLVAAAYGLEASDLKHIFDTFHRGWSDPKRLDIALQSLEEATK
jgi:hypothetical protein